jgi:ABC-2 type transport system ATP-binding protein
MPSAAIEIQDLSHRYGASTALRDLSLTIDTGRVFAFLGPNGGGKTTLFRILSTLMPPQTGQVRILGYDVARHTRAVRGALGIVFQAPSLDRKLTVRENLWQQAALYGVRGRELRERSHELLGQLGLTARRDQIVETLSGGLRRRAELAKGMIHRPALLLLDEPSTGLDPAARGDLWRYLLSLRQEAGVTIVLTSHLLDEADRADQIGILHQGQLVALDTPSALRASVGGDAVTIESDTPGELARQITERFRCPAEVVEEAVRLEQPDGHRWIARLVEAFPERINSIKVGKPTLEDVFIAKTGHRFWSDSPDA